MLKPFRILQNVANFNANFARCKVIFKDGNDFLKRGEYMKRWNKDNDYLFGKVLRVPKRKAKKSRQNKSPGDNQNPLDTIQEKSSTIQSLGRPSTSTLNSQTIVKDHTDPEEKSINSSEVTKYKVQLSDSFKDPLDTCYAMKPLIHPSVMATKNSPFFSVITRNLRSFPLTCNQKVTLEARSDSPHNGKLIIVTPEMHAEARSYPAVTSILNETMSEQSKAALEKWKQDKITELGLKGFELFKKSQLDVGVKFHKVMERFLIDSKEPILDKDIEGVWSSSGDVVRALSKARAIESHVVHPILKYRGIIDCIAQFEDKPTLIEWKRSDKPKHSLTSTFDNPVQLAAYFGAISHDPNYKQLKIRDALLVIAYTDGSKADCFHLNAEEMRKHWGAWLTRYEKYLEIKGSDQTTLIQGGKRMFEEDVKHL